MKPRVGRSVWWPCAWRALSSFDSSSISGAVARIEIGEDESLAERLAAEVNARCARSRLVVRDEAP